MNKPFSEASQRNAPHILQVLRQYITSPCHVLEIGSGTGQHAVYFGQALPQVRWQPSDRVENLPGIRLWLQEAQLGNVEMPLELDVCQPSWPVAQAELVFSANTLHIMSWPEVECFFQGVARLLPQQGQLLVYGPFMKSGQHTAESNRLFDQWLRERDPASGVRDLDQLNELANGVGLAHVAEHALPANNFVQVWTKTG